MPFLAKNFFDNPPHYYLVLSKGGKKDASQKESLTQKKSTRQEKSSTQKESLSLLC
jgi:hypothetical protein